MRLIKAAITFIAILTVCIQPLWANREPIRPNGLISPRVVAMGGSGVAVPGSAEASTVNPASLVFINWPNFSSGFGQQDLGDQQVWYATGTMPLISQLVSQIGFLSLRNPSEPELQYNSYYMSLAFAVSPNGKLLAGINGKLIEPSLPGVESGLAGGGVDLGLLFTAWEGEAGRAVRAGISMMDAQSVVKAEGQEYLLPSVFRYGLSWQVNKSFITSLEFDSQSSQLEGVDSFTVLRIGAEYTYAIEPLNGLAFRGGYFKRLDQEGAITLGVGAGYQGWRLDYALSLPTGLYDAYHQIGITWGLNVLAPHEVSVVDNSGGSRSEQKAKKKEAEEEVDEQQLAILSVLDSAVDADEDFIEFKPTGGSDFEADEEKDQQNDYQTEEKTETYAYKVPVPEGPAAQEKVSLAVDPEMPASFSGYFNNSGNQYSIVQEDLRLHAVINPFSPNNDGKQDRTIFVGRLVNERLNVARWRLYILKAGEVIRSYKGGSRLPRNLEWDGRDEKGKRLRDGKYSAILRVLDENGMELAAATEDVEIRTRPKPVDITGPLKVTLSGKKSDKSLKFSIPKILGSSDWRFVIYSPSGNRVFDKRGGSQLPGMLTWIPRVRGKAPSAGKYRVVLRYRDDVGLRTKSETSFTINYAQFKTGISAAPSLFKAVKQGGRGVTFELNVKGKVKFKSWKLQVLDQASNQEVKSFAGQGIPPKTIVWDGTDEEGAVISGGRSFLGRLLVMTELGTKAAADSSVIQSDVGAYTGKKALSMNLVRILFDKGKATISDQDKASLTKAAKTVTQYNMEYQLQIIGHADENEGTDKALVLSRKRAQVVADYLVTREKIPAGNVQIVGRGIKKMMVKTGNDEERAKNRRVEVLLYAK